MDLCKLYKTLVISGAMIAASCSSPNNSPTPSVPTVTTPTNAKKTQSSPPTKTSPPATKLDCSTICGGHGRAAFCPIPKKETEDKESVAAATNEKVQMNCCWLMGPEKHPCCDELEKNPTLRFHEDSK